MKLIKKILSKFVSTLSDAASKFDGLKQPAHDKLLHFFYGTILAFIVAGFHHAFGINPFLIIVIVTGVAFLREWIWTFLKKSPFSIMDMVFTIVPAILLYIEIML